MPASPSWNPDTYAQFSDHRARPLADLVSRVLADQPQLVVDLGCGNGPTTLSLGAVWPSARIVGVDSSDTMLAAAREHDTSDRVEWINADLSEWDPTSLGQAPDVIITNSTLQWVPEHQTLIPAWIEALAPGGWFAMQLPNNFQAPTHALLREVAQSHPRATEILAALERPAIGEPSTYLSLLSGLDMVADAWETTYSQVLDPDHTQDNPVLAWMHGTGLRPVLDLLTDATERDAFLTPYAAALAAAYPRTEVGVVLPFRRIFAVAQRKNEG